MANNEATMLPIKDVAASIGIKEDDLLKLNQLSYSPPFSPKKGRP